MKYVDEFRDPEKARTLTQEIHKLVERIVRDRGGLKRPLQIMEVKMAGKNRRKTRRAHGILGNGVQFSRWQGKMRYSFSRKSASVRKGH